MTLPTQDFLQALVNSQCATVIDRTSLLRRLSAVIPGAAVSVGDSGVSVSQGGVTVTAAYPAGAVVAVPSVAVPNISNANAVTVQTGIAPVTSGSEG